MDIGRAGRRGETMSATIAYFFGVFVGVVVTIIVTRPMKSWQDGYNTAKEHYSDWEKGFHAGWDGAFRQIEHIARAWNNRKEKQ